MKRGTKVVVLYGPPGVGKLTVASELAKLTGYRVFHNQLTLDPVLAIFDFDLRKKEAFKLVDKYRLEILKVAAHERVPGVIMTTLYGGTKGEDAWFKKLMHVVRNQKGKVYFIRISCDINELKRRIPNAERRRYRKLVTLKPLDQLMKRFDIFSTIGFERTLIIDNTRLPPKAVAREIKRYIA